MSLKFGHQPKALLTLSGSDICCCVETKLKTVLTLVSLIGSLTNEHTWESGPLPAVGGSAPLLLPVYLYQWIVKKHKRRSKVSAIAYFWQITLTLSALVVRIVAVLYCPYQGIVRESYWSGAYSPKFLEENQ